MMHLTAEKIRKMIEMGHSIGAHTRTHPSVGFSELSDKDFNDEILEPARYLQHLFLQDISTFSYPYGAATDCLTDTQLAERTSDYRLVFTTVPRVNRQFDSPYLLGRYSMSSKDTTDNLPKIFESMITARLT
jgi:peptidoglycan/xylan/chitin deacetylase (PgdA/CDA1 family)